MRKLLLIATLACGTFAWGQTAGSNTGASQRTDHDFDQQQIMPGGQLDQDNRASLDASNAKQDWYQSNLNPFVDQFIRINKDVSPMTASIVDQQDQFNGARPGAMAANASGTDQNRGDLWYNRKVQADAEVNRRHLDAIRSNPNLNSADVE